MKVGFVGLGNIGSVMVRNLIKAGHTLTVYNQTRSRAEELQSLGIAVARSSSEAASGAEALITTVIESLGEAFALIRKLGVDSDNVEPVGF